MTATVQALPTLLLKARETSLATLKPILQSHGLTEPQWRVLQVLYRRPDLNAQTLAAESCILSPSLSRILSRFVVDGIVLREIQQTDQRSVTLKLSAKGRRLCQRLIPKLEAQCAVLAQDSGAEIVEQLAELLHKFIASH